MNNQQMSTEVEDKQENPFYNLLFNIILPVTILNQLSKRLGENGPIIALFLALLFPIVYGLNDYLKRKKRNYISLLGILNISFTGGLALFNLGGIWFAIKEAFFPLIIGIAVFISNRLGKPFLKTIFWNDKIFRLKTIEQVLVDRQQLDKHNELFIRSTYLFALSFFISAVLNFYLASNIFLPIDSALSDPAQKEMLNAQIAQMTWQGYLVIALPMMLFMGLILWYVIHGLKQITGFKTEELLVSDS